MIQSPWWPCSGPEWNQLAADVFMEWNFNGGQTSENGSVIKNKQTNTHTHRRLTFCPDVDNSNVSELIRITSLYSGSVCYSMTVSAAAQTRHTPLNVQVQLASAPNLQRRPLKASVHAFLCFKDQIFSELSALSYELFQHHGRARPPYGAVCVAC